MAFSDLKITSSDEIGKTISELDDVVTGQASTLKARFDAMDALQKSRFNSLCDMLSNIYPVGAIYISANSTDPSTLFGGTWEAIAGKFLIGADTTYTAGETGGSATHYHELVDNAFARINIGGSATWADVVPKSNFTANSKTTVNSTVGSTTASGRVKVDGSTANGSNIPPYMAVYMWKRTA